MVQFHSDNPDFGILWNALERKTLVNFMAILEYFKEIWYILLPLGEFMVSWYIFDPFWYIAPRKIWQPCMYQC
jgi:hypothetical protein